MKPYGKTRRLAESIAAVAGQEMAERITAGLAMPLATANVREKSAWVREVMARMDALLPEPQRREIMARRACRTSQKGIALERELWCRCVDLADYARRKAPEWRGGFICEGNTLRLLISRDRCYCALTGSPEAPISKTHCLCCAGHVRISLEGTFGLPVDVDVASTIISGDDACWLLAYVGGRANAHRPMVRPAERQTPPRPAPLKARVVPLPPLLSVAAAEAEAVRLLHGALTAIITASAAETPATQLAMKADRSLMLDALWCLACRGELRQGERPYLYQRKRDGKQMAAGVADAMGTYLLTKYRVPGLQGTGKTLKRGQPVDFEVTLTADGPEDGRVVLQMLQQYAQALCRTYGEPVYSGSHRYGGEAYARFRRADMNVFAVDAETERTGD